MKKVISTLAAAIMSASALASVSVSAVNVPASNEYSLSTSTVKNDIVVDNVTVPAGSLAVTVNISNNTGFSASSTKIALGDAYAPITDENDELVIESGSVIGDSCICGITNGEVVFVSTASAEDNVYDGNMFTFYVSSNTSDDETIEIVNTESEDISTIMKNAISTLSLTGAYYCVGDVDNDGRIDSSDASFILSAVNINNGNKLSVATANSNLSYYFPNAKNIVCAQAANPICSIENDGNVSDSKLESALSTGNLNSDDSNDILRYYGLAATGQLDKYNNESNGFCGRKLYYFS